MLITEIYRSIQGESSYTGLPCVFVRLTGCNLRCAWCDSEYTFTGGTRMSVDELVPRVRQIAPAESCRDGAGPRVDGAKTRPYRALVEITGGAPMLQEREG